MKHAARAEHEIAGEADAAGEERDVVGGVARASRSPSAGRPSTPSASAIVGARPRAAASGAPVRSRERRRRLAVVAVVVGQQDRAGAAAASSSASERRRCARRSPGPGSITYAGSRPTIQLLVPLSVYGPGFGARTSAMSCAASSAARRPRRSEQQPGRSLEPLADGAEEVGGVGAVDDPVVGRDRQLHHAPRADRAVGGDDRARRAPRRRRGSPPAAG